MNLDTLLFIFHSHLHPLPGAPCLQVLDVSQNALGSTGIEMLLKFLNPEVIKSLNMSSVVAVNDTISLCKQVASYFNQVCIPE